MKITLTFALKHRNADVLEEKFWAVSDPQSPQYGEFLTVAELTELIAPPSEAVDRVLAWLRANGVVDTRLTLNRDFIVAEVTVAVAERLLATEFHDIFHIETGRAFVRALEPYSVPAEVADAVEFVGGVHRLPRADHVKSRVKVSPGDSAVVPSVIKQVFNIPSDLVGKNATNSQSVNQFLGQYYSPTDLAKFQSLYGLPDQPVSKVDGYNDAQNPGIEAALDIEYIIATAQNISTWFISTNGTNPDGQEPFLNWMVHLSNLTDAPPVISVSYGDVESSLSVVYTSRVNQQFMKFGLTGKSILFSSGDDGVGCTTDCKRFEPNFPASSPYVTSVGGVVLQDATNKLMTGDAISSGGFSNYFKQPTYQRAAVAAYVKAGGLPPQTFWIATGRAMPDIASFSEDVSIVYDGGSFGVGGTSCAAPVVSGIIALINDARLNYGMKPLGFLNPFLYQTLVVQPEAFFDITQGQNPSGCCTQGFNARVGWDPITGVGAPNFPNLLNAALAIGKKRV